VSYFPLLVAGLLRELRIYCLKFKVKGRLTMRKPQGAYQFIWDCKKVVIADTCATYANAIFDNYTHMNSVLVWERFILLFRFTVIFQAICMALGMSVIRDGFSSKL
jgi:hypothetical protein